MSCSILRTSLLAMATFAAAVVTDSLCNYAMGQTPVLTFEINRDNGEVKLANNSSFDFDLQAFYA
jgi:hypothetical protein